MGIGELFFSFKGRIGRQSYWLANIPLVVLSAVAGAAPLLVDTPWGDGINVALSLLVLYASLAVAAKRWHDRDKTGWWSALALVPVLGWIWMLVENGFLAGTPGRNAYGADPA